MAEKLGENVWYEPDLNKLFNRGIRKRCKKCKKFSREVINELCENCRNKQKT
jgi:hypothetical protein